MYSHKTNFINQSQLTQFIQQLGLLLKNNQLSIDSRKLNSSSIFCAYPGSTRDGRDFIPVALDKNVSAILWEPGINFEYHVTNYPVQNLMHYVGIFAAYHYDYPSSKIKNCFAVTGTNGKTSITHWLNQAYSYLGVKSAIIGTTGAGIYPDVQDYASTTPDPITLQNLIHQFTDEQVETLAMEVSSHALTQGRVNGMNFTTAIFTNLTQDHLDYHLTMENYASAKEQLFYWQGLKNVVINVDDKYGREYLSNLSTANLALNIISYGLQDGDLRGSNIQLTTLGTSFNLEYQGKTQLIEVAIIGKFNVYNLLAVFAALLLNGVTWVKLPEIAAELKPVTGRMDAEIIIGKPLVVVDYSHTPDALENALSTLNELKSTGKLICVFGCGGNRDKTKRPLMGAIAAKLADKVIVTSDNPRDEEPEQIIADITQEIKTDNYSIICDRRLAIETAYASARVGDVVLVAGKGHEDYQEIKGIKHHFSDLEIVKELLRD